VADSEWAWSNHQTRSFDRRLETTKETKWAKKRMSAHLGPSDFGGSSRIQKEKPRIEGIPRIKTDPFDPSYPWFNLGAQNGRGQSACGTETPARLSWMASITIET
jgi:hypothetical protein